LGADEESCKEAVMAAVRSYRRRMKDFAEMGHLELWYTSITEKKVLKTLTPEMQKAFEKITGKARTRTHMQVLAKLTDIVDEKYRLRDEAPLIMHPARTRSGNTIEQATELFLQSYLPSLADDRRTLLEHYRIVDVARKVVGVGSVGTACWVIFLTGNHNEDPLFLQIKEAQPSVLEPFIGKTIYNNNGQRVVAGQRLLQAAPDIFLGWGKLEGRDFYVRQLRDFKGGAEFDPASANVKGLAPYSALCAWALALSHAKSGDAAMIAGYVGNSDELDEAMSKFAFAYADQTIKDHKALAAAAKSKKIKVAGAKS
jgi:uncharacterized protein (DUF2252 family)